MPEKKGFDLGDYVEVKDRIARFYELFGQGRLVTGEVRTTSEPDGKPRVWVQGLAYRTPDDPLPGVGWSWMELPGTTTYTRGSELENTETSAWGRAIGSLGILIDRSIASQNEVQSKSGEPARHMGKPDPSREAVRADEPVLEGPWSGTGAIHVNRKGPADGLIRQEPEGPVVIVAFEPPDGKKIPQAVVRGGMALDFVDAAGNDLNGLLATFEGDLYRVPWYPEPNVRREFQRLEVHRISTASWSLPVPEPAGVGQVPVDAHPRAGSPTEADEKELDGLLL